MFWGAGFGGFWLPPTTGMVEERLGHRAAEERADGFLGRELVLPVEAEIPLRSVQLCSRLPQTGIRE